MESNFLSIDIEKTLITSEGIVPLSVSLEIRMHELLVLFGNSGIGKTTLLRMLAGLTKPDRGFIRFGNEVWFDSSKNICLSPQKRNIGFMFQDYALFPNMTVEENMAYAQPVYKKEEIYNMLEKFGITEFAKRKPHNLSGGQKQRVALARTIIKRPKLLLLDEPFSALDAKMRTKLQDELKAIHTYLGSTTLVVSHDLAEVFRLAQKVIRLDEGKVKDFGHPSEVFLNNSVSGKFQTTGSIVSIEAHDIFYLLGVVTGSNQLVKVVAFEDDIKDLKTGDQVMICSKAFNPIILKLNKSLK